MFLKTIVWFRQDLRLHDHPALIEAAKRGRMIPVFILSKEEQELFASPASMAWLHRSLQALQEALHEKGLTLILKTGDYLEQLLHLAKETGANAVFFNERYERPMSERDKQIMQVLRAKHIDVRSFHAHLLFDPFQILNQKKAPFKVFTPFWKRCMQETVSRPLFVPQQLHGCKEVSTLELDQLELRPTIRWDEKIFTYWQPGEAGAIRQWQQFIENGLWKYEKGRDFPAKNSVSHLSPHLAWGEISVKAIWYAAMRYLHEHDESIELAKNVEAFLRQLIWREFAYHQLIHFPTLTYLPLREPFVAFPTVHNEEHLERWKRGLTGYPLVDAGMRELWETGTMHNRVRMVAASFLVKHLLLPWTVGAKWFQETLVDFDVANNAIGWQWTAGCGLDAAPYFRIFNPITQSEKFDPNGDYIRKWIPELAKLPAPHIHRPWAAPKAILQEANIEMGKTYPEPIIDHSFARERALKAYETIKKHGSNDEK